MERRKAITVAGVVSGALLVGALAMTASAGILGAPNNDKVGHLQPVVATPSTTIVYVDDPPAVAATTAPTSADPDPTVAHDDGGHEREHGGGEDDD